MKTIENYEEVQANTGEFARPTTGGYICQIIDAEDIPMGTKKPNQGDYLRIEYDIAVGEFEHYYKEQYERWGGNWYASFIRSYKDTALGMFKHFTNCVEESNPGYEWDWNEKGLIGKYIGLILGEEEYENGNGEIKIKLVVKQIKTVDEIRNNDFKVPAIKRLEKKSKEEFVPADINDIIDDLPFN